MFGLETLLTAEYASWKNCRTAAAHCAFSNPAASFRSSRTSTIPPISDAIEGENLDGSIDVCDTCVVREVRRRPNWLVRSLTGVVVTILRAGRTMQVENDIQRVRFSPIEGVQQVRPCTRDVRRHRLIINGHRPKSQRYSIIVSDSQQRRHSQMMSAYRTWFKPASFIETKSAAVIQVAQCC